MIQEQEEDCEYNVYYRGTKEQLFAFLYPLTGPENSVFDHLQQKQMLFDSNKKQFEIRYQPKDFQNIDKQKQQIIYTSTLVSTQSNYFYSTFQPQHNCFIWQSVSDFVELRPKNRGMAASKEKEIVAEQNKVQLDIIDFQSPSNKTRNLMEDTIMEPLKQNWEVCKDEYLLHLAK